MPFTGLYDEKIVKKIFSDTNFTAPTDLYVALSTTTPKQIKGSSPYWNFTEPSGDGYARVEVVNSSSYWVATTTQPSTTEGYVMVNEAAVTFPTPTGSWGTVTYFGVFSASVTGTLICFGELTTAKAIGTGDTPPSFAAKALKIKND